MKTNKLKDMVGGWFIGNFSPSVINTKEFEVAIKEYSAGATEPKHYHLLAEEITVVVSGHIQMNGKDFFNGDIITVKKKESVIFKAITNAITVVVKTPSETNDKYIEEL